jgi:hypothetical protein
MFARLLFGAGLLALPAVLRAETQPPAAPPPPAKPQGAEPARPPPLHAEYVQYGLAFAAEFLLHPGAACPDDTGAKPCILGGGGGLAVRGGYRSPGPWYIGGASEFIKTDSSNLYRLGILQQLRAEMRYLPDLGSRVAPYGAWGLGGVAYGNEWGVETGGAVVFGGAGMEIEVSRVAVLGVALVYRPMLIAGWTDTAGQVRKTAFVQFLGLELVLEVRTEFSRR